MTKELYEQVKDEVPNHIGVYIGQTLEKRAKRQELGVDEQILKNSMVRSLYREFEKQYESGDVSEVERLKKKINRLETENKNHNKECKSCRKDICEDKRILRFALKKLGITRQELEDEFYKEESD